jgi:hypothetical protein
LDETAARSRSAAWGADPTYYTHHISLSSGQFSKSDASIFCVAATAAVGPAACETDSWDISIKLHYAGVKTNLPKDPFSH